MRKRTKIPERVLEKALLSPRSDFLLLYVCVQRFLHCQTAVEGKSFLPLLWLPCLVRGPLEVGPDALILPATSFPWVLGNPSGCSGSFSLGGGGWRLDAAGEG